MKYAFAGDREISLSILRFLISKGFNPSALFISDSITSSHSQELIAVANLEDEFVFRGKNFKDSVDCLSQMELDYIFGIHFPYIIPKELLELPKVGFLNLHPAFLPFNKGWHTPSWAIIDDTKYGATLHFMSEKLDEGNIIHQKELVVEPSDTANTLYQKTLKLEEEVFFEALDELKTLSPKSIKQIDIGTSHLKSDLQSIQEINLDKSYKGKEIINILRGLTTNNLNEAAYFLVDNEKYYMQLSISKINK